MRPEGDRVRLALPFTAGTVNLRGVAVPLDLPDVTDLLGIRLGVPSSITNITFYSLLIISNNN